MSFFIDRGDKPKVLIGLYVRIFEPKQVSVIYEAEGHQFVTNEKFDYWKDTGEEIKVDADCFPILEGNVPARQQLFKTANGIDVINATLLNRLYEEATIKHEIKMIDKDTYKIVICQRKQLLNDPICSNSWMIFSALDKVSVQDLIKAGR